MWYTFNQNNSGGSFDYDKDRGITHFVVIEADSAAEANDRAERIGLYFDGSGDCPCCGNRWSDQWNDDKGTENPEIYGDSPEAYIRKNSKSGWGGLWMDRGREIAVHHKGGGIDWF